MSTLLYQQYQAVQNPVFRGMVEGSMMICAYTVLNGDRNDPDYQQRAGLSRTLLTAETQQHVRTGYITLFCWWAVNQYAVITAFNNAGGDPAQIPDAVMNDAISEFWDTAANVDTE